MESRKLSTIVYAAGFVADFVEEVTTPLEDDSNDERTQIENERREQVRVLWAVINTGLTELMSENTNLLNKLALVKMTLDR